MKVFASQLTDEELILVLKATGQRDFIGIDIDKDKESYYLSKMPVNLRRKLLFLDAEWQRTQDGAGVLAG